jgi:phosphoribosyl-ATP pyrophosphohydrolase
MKNEEDILKEVYEVILQRKKELPKGSYSASLFKNGLDKIIEKIEEETKELVEEAKKKNPQKDRIIEELVDLWFHTLILLGFYNIPLSHLYQEFKKRRR